MRYSKIEKGARFIVIKRMVFAGHHAGLYEANGIYDDCTVSGSGCDAR